MISSQELYEKFYTKKFNGRKLDWQNTLSSCLITAHFPKGQKEVLMSLSQAVILLMFNNKRKKSISYSEIQTATGLGNADKEAEK
jgi:cullin-4